MHQPPKRGERRFAYLHGNCRSGIVKTNKLLFFHAALTGKINALKDWHAVILLAAVFFLPAYAVYNVTDAHGDIAEYLNDAYRVTGGEMPYRDFWLLLPPGKVFIPALVFHLLGPNVNAVMIAALIINVATGIAAYFLCRQITASKSMSFATALLVYFNGSISLSYGLMYPHTWLLFVFLSAIFVMRHFNSSAAPPLMAAGAFAGLAFFFEFFLVGSFCFAAVFAIVAHARATKGRPSASLYPLAWFFFSAAAVVAAELTAIHGIAAAALYTVIIEAPSHGTSLNLPYFRESLFSMESLILCYAPILLAVCFARYYRDKWMSPASVIAIFFFLWVAAAFPKALGRSDLNHVAQSVTPMYFFFAAYIGHFSANGQKAIGLNKWILRILAAAALLLFVYDAQKFFEHAINDAFKEKQPVQTSYGKLLLTDLALAAEINAVIADIQAETKEGDYIFLAPWELPPLYAMTHRKNPAYYDSMMEILWRPAAWKEESVCSALMEKDAKLAVLSALRPTRGKSPAEGLEPMQIIGKCVENNYSLLRRSERFTVYVKKTRPRDSARMEPKPGRAR